MLTRRLVLALLAAAALALPAHAADAVTGLDVTLVTYTGLPDEPSFHGTQTFKGHGKWVEKNSNGTYNYVEKSRTASKITLWDAKRKVTVIIAVKVGGTLSWIWNGSPVTPYAKITALAK